MEPRRSLFHIASMALFACCAVLSPACRPASNPPGTLRVLAAASLRDVLDELGNAYAEEHGIEVVIVTGGSNLVAQQLLAGAQADLFVSAGALEVERLLDASLLVPNSRQNLFYNQLVVIAPVDADADSWSDPLVALGKVKRLSIAHPEAVPAGRYAKVWLEERALWTTLKGRTVFALDVRAALAAVASGGTAAGIVYRTDAMTSDAVRVVYEVPLGADPRVVYPAAITTHSTSPEHAAAFLAFATGPMRARVTAHGFGVFPQD